MISSCHMTSTLTSCIILFNLISIVEPHQQIYFKRQVSVNKSGKALANCDKEHLDRATQMNATQFQMQLSSLGV